MANLLSVVMGGEEVDETTQARTCYVLRAQLGLFGAVLASALLEEATVASGEELQEEVDSLQEQLAAAQTASEVAFDERNTARDELRAQGERIAALEAELARVSAQVPPPSM